MKLWDQAGRGQSVTSLRLLSPSFSLSSPPPAPPAIILHRLAYSATDRKSQTSSYPCSSCFAFPFFFIKLPKQQSVAVVAWRSVQLASPAIAGAQLDAPLPFHPIGWPRLLSGSNGILSVAIEAIGKQRLKMNYPVSSSSLMNK